MPVRKFIRTLRRRLAQLRSVRERFGTLVHKERKLLWLGAMAMTIETGCLIALSFPLRYLTDVLLIPSAGANKLPFMPEDFYLTATEEQRARFLWIVCALVLVIATLIGVFGYLRTVWCATAGQRIVMKLRKQLYGHLHLLSLRFHHGNRIGDLMVRITGDIPMLRDILSGAIIDLIGRMVLVVAWFGVMVWIDPVLAIASSIVLVVVGLLSALFAKRIVKIVKRQRKQEGILAYTTSETLSSLTLVKALGREDEVVRRFARKNRTAMRAGLKGTRLQASLSRYVEIVLAGGLAVVIFVGMNKVLAGALTAGALLQFISSLRNLNKPLRRVSRISTQIGKAAACGERITEVLDIEPEEVDAPDAIAAPLLRGEIEFREVEFSYVRAEDISDRPTGDEEDEEDEDALDLEEDSTVHIDDGLDLSDFSATESHAEKSSRRTGDSKPDPARIERPRALAGVSLRIEPGEVIALVGRNGAGKSTMMNLLLRLYEPTGGTLFFDGVASQKYTIRSLRDQISIALQHTYLFGSTVHENLLFSAPEATPAEIHEALRLVGGEFFEALPEGIDTELAEGGSNLSGGQRRKLALAGALLRKAPILVLDEPTAAIDQASRDDLLRRLPEAIKGRTTILIAHDSALLAWADRVVYLEDGQIVADGTHEQLQATSDGYRALFPEAAEGKGALR